MSDLISRTLAGDEAAFQSLYDAHAGRIKAYFLRCGFPAADADDLTQESFVRAYRALAQFDPQRGSFAVWLGAIARNVARKSFARPNPAHDFDPGLAEEVLSDPAPGVPADAARREELDALALCIEALPPELARIVHLRYVQGRTTRSIGVLVNLAEATVRLRLEKIHGLLGQCMEAKGFLE